MKTAAIQILERWLRIEDIGIALCDTLASSTLGDQKRSWTVMAELERCVHRAVSKALGFDDGASKPCADSREAGRSLALAYLTEDRATAALRMAKEVCELITNLRSEIANLHEKDEHIFVLLVEHEEAWLSFLTCDAAGDTNPHAVALPILADCRRAMTYGQSRPGKVPN